MCLGDFNEVLIAHEHEGAGQRRQAQMDGFRDALDVCALEDLGYQGRAWTFEKKTSGGAYCRVRLDRAVASNDWIALFPHATLFHETAATSDHAPIRLQLEPQNTMHTSKKIFRYELYWEKHAEYKDALNQLWTGEPGAVTVAALNRKLQNLSVSLKQWSGRDNWPSD